MNPPNDRLHFPRTMLARMILAGFEQHIKYATTIFAPRRKGKTTFVNRDFVPLARKRGYTVAMADLWLDKKNPEQVIAAALAESIHETGLIRRNLVKMSRPGTPLKTVSAKLGVQSLSLGADLSDEPSLALPELFKRFRKVSNGKAILIIDEVQHLATNPAFEDFTATLRTLLQGAHGEVFALFTGSSQSGLAAMFRRSKAPFFQYSSEMSFPDLGLDFVQHFADRFQEVTGREWEIDKAFELYVSRGMMPQYLRELYSVSLTQNIPVAEADKLVWEQMIDEGQFTALLNDLSPLDLLVLRGVLTGQPLYNEQYRTSLADELPSGTSPTTTQIQSALKRLERRDLVTSLERGTWAIEDSTLQSFLSRLMLEDR